MIFCGQCGYQLASGDTQCPRCGTLLAEDAAQAPGVSYPNAPTVQATSSFPGRRPTPEAHRPQGSMTGAEQQKLVLRPDPGSDYNAAASDATSMMQQPPLGSSYVDQRQAGTGNFLPPQGSPLTRGGSYPGFTQGTGQYPPRGASYGGLPPVSGFQQPMRGEVAASTGSRGRNVSLIVILIGLLLILTAMALFILQRSGMI
jgi:hypothetical protein